MEATSSYRIQAVSRMTGVAPATLRAWERRYGFPSPSRSSSAYRLFSQRDVELVRRMQKLVESGVAPNEAARQLLAGGAKRRPIATADPYEDAADRLLAAIEKMDAELLQAELRRAFVLDSGTVVFARVLRPVLQRVGDLWARGAISVAHEHLASHLIRLTILDLIRTTAVDARAPTLLLACFADETHELPLYGAALSAASWGFRPVMLGARTPPTALARAVETIGPAWVGLSVTVVPEPKSVARDLVDAYADACRTTPFVIGGAGAGALAGWVEKRGGLVATGELEDMRKALSRRRRRGLARTMNPTHPSQPR